MNGDTPGAQVAPLNTKRTRIIGAAAVGLGAAGIIAALAFGSLGGADPVASPTPTASPSPSGPTAPTDLGPFVTAEGPDLMLGDEPFRYASTNAYTLMFESPAGVDIHMQIAQEMGMEVLRAWAFLDYGTQDGENGVEINNRGIYFQYWDEEAGKPAFNDGEDGLERLDYMLASAREHDIKLLLPLVNNWTAFGGIDQYVRWAGGQYHDDFFTNEEIKGWYKDWVSHLMNRVNTVNGIRYKDDPTIMAWELGNELRCSESGPYPSSDACGSQMLVEWADEMSQFVQQEAPNHLVAFGGEGFLCTDPPGSGDTLFDCTESADPVALLELDGIDIHGIHVYPNHWQPQKPMTDWQEWGAWWINEHGKIATEANKPYYIGEHGWTDQSHRMVVFEDWLSTFYNAGGDGSHFWVMQPASSIGAPPDSVGFTQRCPGAACQLVADWSAHVGKGVAWDDIAPLAESDFQQVQGTDPVVIDIMANDVVRAPATWDPASIDLDPETDGVQTTTTTDAGVFEVADGAVTFTPSGEGSSANTTYVIADSTGRLTPVATITVVISS